MAEAHPNRGSPYSGAVSTLSQSYTGTVCHYVADASCVLGFVPAYGLWADVATSTNDQALATTRMFVDSNGITTSSSIKCNWGKVSDSYSDAEISYTVYSDCHLVASMPGPQALIGASLTGPASTVSVTFPNQALFLGTAFAVESISSSDGICYGTTYIYSTTYIDYAEVESASVVTKSGASIWELPALTDYLPGLPAATECIVTFGTQPNTLKPADYLTIYDEASTTSTGSTSSGQRVSAAEITTKKSARLSGPVVLGSQTLSVGGAAMTVTSNDRTELVSIITAANSEDANSVVVVDAIQTVTADLSSYVCNAGGACGGETVLSVPIGSGTDAAASATATSGAGMMQLKLCSFVLLAFAIVAVAL